jgi:hypothetical protein
MHNVRLGVKEVISAGSIDSVALRVRELQGGQGESIAVRRTEWYFDKSAMGKGRESCNSRQKDTALHDCKLLGICATSAIATAIHSPALRSWQ